MSCLAQLHFGNYALHQRPLALANRTGRRFAKQREPPGDVIEVERFATTKHEPQRVGVRPQRYVIEKHSCLPGVLTAGTIPIAPRPRSLAALAIATAVTDATQRSMG
jgi:hypothetical protein